MSNSIDKKWWEFEVSSPSRRSIINDITAAIGVEQLKKVLSSTTIEKDQIIYEEGEPLGDGYVLFLGKVQLFKNTRNGKLAERQTINSMQDFGVWNSILGNNVRLFTPKALEKSSALIIPKATLDKKLSTLDPFIRLLFRQALSNSENFGLL